VKRVIVANARYWLEYLNAVSGDDLIPEADIRGAARALETVMAVPETWSLTLSLAQALHPHMEQRGYWADWDYFLQGLLTHAQRRVDSVTEADLLAKRGIIQRQRGAYRAAMTSFRRAWWLCRQAGDQTGRARAFSNLGDLCRLQGYFRRAEILCQGALELFEALGDTGRLAATENHLALVYFDRGRWPEALPHLTRSQALWQQVGDRHGLAKTLQNLGVLHHRTGELEAALDYLKQAIRHYQAVGDKIHVARTQLNVGNVYLDRRDFLRAEMIYSQAETVLRHEGDSLDLARVHHNLGMVYTHLENWDEAEACFERALERWRNLEDTWNAANTLGELAGLYLARGCWAEARACLNEAWELVSERDETRYGPLRQELAERQQELQRMTSPQ